MKDGGLSPGVLAYLAPSIAAERKLSFDEVVEIGRSFGLPSTGCYASEAEMKSFVAGLAERLQCRLIPRMIAGGARRLNVRLIEELIAERGMVFCSEGGALYWYNPGKGVYEECARDFWQMLALVKARLDEELERVCNAAGAWFSRTAASIRKALPRSAPLCDLKRDSKALFALWQRPVGSMNGDHGFINLRNGMLDLRTRSLLPHGPEYLTTVQLPYAYDPSARCPTFLSFLSLAAPNPRVRCMLQEWCGALFLRSTRLDYTLILLGPTGSAKGTTIKVMRMLVGEDNCSSLSLDDLGDRFRSGALIGKLLNTSTEVSRRPLDDARFKALVSGDPMTFERKYEAPVTVRPIVRCVFSGNQLPKILDRTGAVHRRLIVANFEQQFSDFPNPDADPPVLQRDPYIEDKLAAEVSGILNWALDGLDAFLDRKMQFDIPEVMLARVQEDLREQNQALRFADEACELGEHRVTAGEMYEAYRRWCKSHGERAVAAHVFGKDLLRGSGVTSKKSGGIRYYCGIRPLDDPEW